MQSEDTYKRLKILKDIEDYNASSPHHGENKGGAIIYDDYGIYKNVKSINIPKLCGLLFLSLLGLIIIIKLYRMRKRIKNSSSEKSD